MFCQSNGIFEWNSLSVEWTPYNVTQDHDRLCQDCRFCQRTECGAGFRITMSEPIVIVGNGMAAACLCEELAQRALGRYAVTVIGEEPRLAYNRVLLSSVLAGEGRASDILLKPAARGGDRGLTL